MAKKAASNTGGIAASLPDPQPGMSVRMPVHLMLSYLALHDLEVVRVEGDTLRVRMPRKVDDRAGQDENGK